MILLVLFLLVVSGSIYTVYRKLVNGICRSRKRLDGKTCLVTGGTRGIGLEIAIDFAMRGARVIVACPFAEEGMNAQKKIVEETGNSNVVFKLLDLASLKVTREFATDILNTEARLDILMNNTGVACPRKKSEDGIDIAMQVNYFGHFLLTLLLLPLLKKSGTPSEPSRIVNTVSVTIALSKLDLGNWTEPRGSYIGKVRLYANSKLCLVLFSREFKRRLSHSNVIMNNADPGEVGTTIFMSGGFIFMYFMYLCILWLGKTTIEGAQTPLYVALDEKVGQHSGRIYRDCKEMETKKEFSDEILAKTVWDKSVDMVNLNHNEVNKSLL